MQKLLLVNIIQKIAPPAKSGNQIWFFPRFGGKNGGVLSMRMQVILDSSFARQGSVPIWGGKKGEFRDWTIFCLIPSPWPCSDSRSPQSSLLQSTVRKKMATGTFTYNALRPKTLKERIKAQRKLVSHSNSTRAMLLIWERLSLNHIFLYAL